jgi:hypothetical protein
LKNTQKSRQLTQSVVAGVTYTKGTILILILQMLVDYWFVFAAIIILPLIYSGTKHNKVVENRRKERVKIIASGGPDPVLDSKEGKQIIFYMFLAVLPIFIIVALVNI